MKARLIPYGAPFRTASGVDCIFLGRAADGTVTGAPVKTRPYAKRLDRAIAVAGDDLVTVIGDAALRPYRALCKPGAYRTLCKRFGMQHESR